MINKYYNNKLNNKKLKLQIQLSQQQKEENKSLSINFKFRLMKILKIINDFIHLSKYVNCFFHFKLSKPNLQFLCMFYIIYNIILNIYLFMMKFYIII